jgi:hypothetical protein
VPSGRRPGAPRPKSRRPEKAGTPERSATPPAGASFVRGRRCPPPTNPWRTSGEGLGRGCAPRALGARRRAADISSWLASWTAASAVQEWTKQRPPCQGAQRKDIPPHCPPKTAVSTPLHLPLSARLDEISAQSDFFGPSSW